MLASMSAAVTRALAPGMTTMQFSPALETRMSAVPELPSVVWMAVVSTPEVCRWERSRSPYGIVAELADHLDGIAEAGDGDGLIGSFAAGVNLEAGAGDGFAGEGNVFDGGDEVGVDAAYDNDRLSWFDTLGAPPNGRWRALQDGREGDGGQSDEKEDKHDGEEGLRLWRRVAELAPDEDAPAGGDHGCALSDGVGDCRADGLAARGDEVEHRAGAPDCAADDSPEMPASVGLPVARHADWFAAVEGLAHEQVIYGHGADGDSENEEECGGVGALAVGCVHGFGDEGVEAAHEQAGDDADDDSAFAHCELVGVSEAVGGGVEEDGGDDEGDSAEEKEAISGGGDEIAGDRSDDEGYADSHGKGDCETCDVDCGDEEKVRDVEDDAAEDRVSDARCA